MKNVLITGGATGIGKAVALMFKENGYEVNITYNKTKPDYDGVNKFKCDVANIDELKSVFSNLKKLDVLVNDAGVSLIKQINDTTEYDFNELMSVNLKAVYFASKYAAEKMIKEKKGSIINISSVWGEVGASCETLYSSSKAAVIGLTKALAKELAPSNITVNSVSPGVINTRMNSEFDETELKSIVPLERLGKPEEVASAVMFFAENRYITGQDLSVNGGLVI